MVKAHIDTEWNHFCKVFASLYTLIYSPFSILSCNPTLFARISQYYSISIFCFQVDEVWRLLLEAPHQKDVGESADIPGNSGFGHRLHFQSCCCLCCTGCPQKHETWKKIWVHVHSTGKITKLSPTVQHKPKNLSKSRGYLRMIITTKTYVDICPAM